jgi:hypothetical protein
MIYKKDNLIFKKLLNNNLFSLNIKMMTCWINYSHSTIHVKDSTGFHNFISLKNIFI